MYTNQQDKSNDDCCPGDFYPDYEKYLFRTWYRIETNPISDSVPINTQLLNKNYKFKYCICWVHFTMILICKNFYFTEYSKTQQDKVSPVFKRTMERLYKILTSQICFIIWKLSNQLMHIYDLLPHQTRSFYKNWNSNSDRWNVSILYYKWYLDL